ncbi:zinc-finger domain-containing protein [Aquariibacter albus]|uniref:Zinc-finger domain-containing protein n=1 Tax=Aquariibacter albus TaxID=2759899 RepID=A0A839HTA2_9BURK|nr:zinc-finger domain-containing protein [Aquariibacter albus]MBB1162928.1 zinc-finger domain-containing protein [Aquariibacter albus]
MSTATSTDPKAVVEVGAADLHGPGVVFCPNPKMPLWSNHPRVYLDVASTGEARCAYCGTVYRLKAGETLHGHH